MAWGIAYGKTENGRNFLLPSVSSYREPLCLVVVLGWFSLCSLFLVAFCNFLKDKAGFLLLEARHTSLLRVEVVWSLAQAGSPRQGPEQEMAPVSCRTCTFAEPDHPHRPYTPDSH